LARVIGRSTAQHIAAVAAKLFYRDGIHAVGVDRIAEVSGVTKRTLYKHYRTRDDLLVAALRLPTPVAIVEIEGTPAERILRVFGQVEEWVREPDFRGCPHLNAAVELANPHHPARAVARDIKENRLRWFLERARELDVAEPGVFAEQLMVLFDGAVAACTLRGPSPAVAATRAVKQLLREWLRTEPVHTHGKLPMLRSAADTVASLASEPTFARTSPSCATNATRES
jgi:AcrR family transcriptional regulator